MKPIAEALRDLIAKAGMTDTEVWSAAGLSSGSISRYKGGSRGSTSIDWRGAETIEKLAAVFGVDPSYFIEYRMWQVREIARKYPRLADQAYGLLISYARSVGDNVSSRSRGT